LLKPTIIIQARLGSKRFPEKVLEKIENKSLIWHVINRAKNVNGVEQIILATTKKKEDRVLVKIAENSGIIGFVGNDVNVLERYYQCAKKFNADPIIRITGDCPLIDPKIIEDLLKYYSSHDFNYVTNTNPPTYPDGLDIEIFSFSILETIRKKVEFISEREHVTSYIKKHPTNFKIYNLKNDIDLSQIRLTVDEELDLKIIKKLYAQMRPNKLFGLKDIIKIISKNPKLIEINNSIVRNEGYFISLKNDKKINL
jgi:spore coat polysaccharide biosynthesis protein SpsF (cytidylyltransferase family)